MKIRIQNLKPKTNLLCKFVFGFIFLIWVNVANAQIIITEIMYNPEGSDTGKEYIEIYNNGNETVDLDGWKLFEAETNHRINSSEEGGNLEISANYFAVMVDKVDKFKTNYPNFSGLIFDSSYSLSNTGETLIIRDSDLNDIDTVNYSSNLDADGDGNSLQLIDGNWVSFSPSIGSINDNQTNQNNSSDSAEEEIKESNKDNNESNIENNVQVGYSIEPQIFANAGKDKKVIVGADTEFKGRAIGLKNKPIENARYSWTFGDGGSKEGKNILYNYKYPGEYVVVLNVSSGEFSASDRVLVEALPADIVISKIDSENNSIELHNKSDYELNLSWWRIRSGVQYFTLPRDTIILAGKKLILPFRVTNLNFSDINQIYILYPNGEILYKYSTFVESYKVSGRMQIQKVKTQSIKTQNPNLPTGQAGKTQSINTKIKQNEEKVELNQKIIKKEKIKDNEDQLALIGNTIKKEKSSDSLFNKWTFSLVGLIIISIMSVLFLKGFGGDLDEGNEEGEDFQLKPDDFKIVE